MYVFQVFLDDLDGLHDVLIEFDGRERSEEEVLEVFMSLDRDIQFIAFQWSCSDTEFCDAALSFLKKKAAYKAAK